MRWPWGEKNSIPQPVPFTTEGGKTLEALIAEGRRLLEPDMLDEEAYPEGKSTKPDVMAARALKSEPYTKWFTGSVAFLEAICGKAHSLPRTFFWTCESGVVDGARKGVGMLTAAMDAWQRGQLWPAK